MDYSKKWSNAEIEKLCKDVCNQVKGVVCNEGNDTIRRLRQICGKTECGCGNFTPAQNLSQLLKIMPSDAILTDCSVGLSIMNNYNTLGHEHHCQTALEQILRYSLSESSSENREQFLKQLWNYPGLRNFDTKAIKDFIYGETRFIEEDLFKVFEKTLKKNTEVESIWRIEPFERIAFWSCKSARIFCLVTSVLNTWLQHITVINGQMQTCISVVSQFINSVKQKCVENKIDFVFLYPSEYHRLVILLDINPDMFPEIPENRDSVALSTVVELIKQNLCINPVQTLCLLTHFPEWAQFVKL